MKKSGTANSLEGNILCAMRIMDALSAVDEELLERCRKDGVRSVSGAKIRRRPLWQNARAWAAVMCMALLGAAAFGGYQFIGGIRYGAYDSGGAMDGAAPQQFLAEMNEEEMTADQEPASADGQGTQSAGGWYGEEAGQPETASADGGQDDSAGAGSLQNAMNNGSGSGGDGYSGSGKASTTDGAQNGGDDKTAEEKSEKSQEEGASSDGDVQSCKAMTAEKYTLEQAAALEGLGSYVPQKLPVGYSFESAYQDLDVDWANLTVSWSRGMDCLMLNIQEVSTMPQTVDIGKSETYDVRLYEIPYAETVPQEYRQTFDNPVFAWEDMSLEIVESRMKSYTDSGDTDTPRGDFSVLFSDGILVRFNGRGTAEQIWAMFGSMGAAE